MKKLCFHLGCFPLITVSGQFNCINCLYLRSKTIPPLPGWYESSEEKRLLLFLNLSEHTEKLDPPHPLPPRGSWELGSVSTLSPSCSEMVLSLHTPLADLPVICLGGLSITGFGMLPMIRRIFEYNHHNSAPS